MAVITFNVPDPILARVNAAVAAAGYTDAKSFVLTQFTQLLAAHEGEQATLNAASTAVAKVAADLKATPIT